MAQGTVARRFRALVWVGIGLFFLSGIGRSQDRILLRLIRPQEQFRIDEVTTFLTTQAELTVVGEVHSPGGTIRLSVETPDGVPSWEAAELPLRQLTLDLGRSAALQELVLLPVIQEPTPGEFRSLGPRTLVLRLSEDGRSFGDPWELAVPSGVAAPDGRAVVPLPEGLRGRFLRLFWKDGWQRYPDAPELPDVRLLGLEVTTAQGEVLVPRLIRITAEIPNAAPVQPFQLTVRLQEGRNAIRLEAVLIDPEDLSGEQRSDTATVNVVYRPEILPALQEAEPLNLSDGSRLLIQIPPGAAPETLRGVDILPADPASIDPSTYSRHRQIPPGGRPVLAYRFQGRFQIPFRAEASASLPGQPPSLAVDGRLEDPSAWVSSLVPFPIRWKVDLRKSFPIGRIVVHARVVDGVSFAPSRAKIYVSTDNATFELAAEVDAFAEETTSISLPAAPQARWVELLIEEGKQPNVVQIREIEFFKPNGRRIVAEERRSAIPFAQPVRLVLRVEPELIAPPAEGWGLFLWNPATQQWEQLTAQSVSSAEGLRSFRFEAETATLAPLALFPVRTVPPAATLLSARWSLRSFSPNGDGVADVNRLRLEVAPQPWTPEVSVHLFDLHGRRIRTLVDRRPVQSGVLTVEWDGRDRDARPVPIGVYLYQVELFRPDRGQPETVYNGVVGVAR